MTNEETIQEAAHQEAARRWPEYATDPEHARARSAFTAGVRYALSRQSVHEPPAPPTL